MTLVDASDGSLRATGLDRLSASDCAEFKELVQPCLSTSCRLMELDCSTVRSPIVRPLLRMLHLDELFELTP